MERCIARDGGETSSSLASLRFSQREELLMQFVSARPRVSTKGGHCGGGCRGRKECPA